MNLTTDERGYTVGWMGKLLIVVALLCLFMYDAAALAVNAFQLDSLADEIAIEVSTSAADGVGHFDLEREARRMARKRGARVVELDIDRREETLQVTVRREANTLIVKHWSRTADWGRMSATGRSST